MSVNMEHNEIRDLLGVYALDAIADDTERELVIQHLDRCAECRAEVAEHLEALAMLAPIETSELADGIWDGVRDRITPAGSDIGPLAQVVPLRPRWGRSVAAVAAVAAAAVLVTVAVTRDGGLGDPAQTAEVVPAAQQASAVSGQVKIFDSDTQSGRLVLKLDNVPDAPADHHYEVWVLRPGSGVEMEAVGAFTPEDGSARLELPLPGPGEYVAVDISVQENGGSAVHSGTSLAGASFVS
jgi:anti-sigma-K factor RskA